ncbi:hypothetical protein A2U01_0104514, partial [Trifolium medium]|nr:hypothetical protein [Trifolium medium]
RDLQVGIQNDVAKLLAKRHTLVRLQDKQKKLGDELCVIMEDSDTVKRCKRTLEDMQTEATEAAKDLDCAIVD